MTNSYIVKSICGPILINANRAIDAWIEVMTKNTNIEKFWTDKENLRQHVLSMGFKKMIKTEYNTVYLLKK